jgi:DNA adenine methylase
MAEPIVKWVGGKRQLLSELSGRFPPSFTRYHEPFVGGGAAFFELEPDGGTINDLNEKLITLYRAVRDHPEKVIAENRTHTYERGYYEQQRDEFNELFKSESLSETDEIRATSLFIYLNRAGYNGLYRENNSGEFNVPFGRHSNPDFVRKRQIRAASEALKGVDVLNKDFEYVLEEVDSNDLVYFDPPYEPVSETADFTQYQAEDFDKEDQRRLRDVASELDSRGAYVTISNSPPVAELYHNLESFSIDTVAASRSVNSDADNRGDVAEVIITNIPAAEQRQQTLSSF